MFILITTFKNTVVEFASGCLVATRRYKIINSVSKIYCFLKIFTVYVALPL